MHTELIHPFTVAFSEVLAQEAGIQAKRGSVSLNREAYVTEDVTILINLVGDAAGMAIYGLSRDTAKGIVSRILRQEVGDFNELAQSGIAELGNVVTGQATIGLAQMGLVTDISVPALLIGKGSRISTLDIERLAVPLETELGTVRVDLALRVSQTGGKQRSNKGVLHIVSEQ